MVTSANPAVANDPPPPPYTAAHSLCLDELDLGQEQRDPSLDEQSDNVVAPDLDQQIHDPYPLEIYQGTIHYMLEANRKNQSTNALLGLPDTVLVAIMQNLDLDDILQLRHTSRDFLRLFSQSKEFRKYHLTDKIDRHRRTQLARVWATPLKLIRHVRDDGLCQSCTDFRRRKCSSDNRGYLNDIPFIYCSGCKREHRAFYFSPEQRHGSNDDERLCINREKRATLCEHVSVTWDSANRLADRPPGEDMIRCHDPQHTAHSHCDHVRDGTPTNCSHDDQPYILFWRDGNKKLHYLIGATIHVPFLRKEHQEGGGFTDEIEDLIRCGLPHESSPWAITSYGDSYSAFLSPFDPNICSCLDWTRDQNDDVLTWKLSPNPHKPWRKRATSASNIYAGKDENRCNEGDRCAGFAHCTSHSTPGVGGKLYLNYCNCPADHETLVLEQRVHGSASSPMDPGWAWLINRYSSVRSQDEEMRGISWCSDMSCCWKQLRETDEGLYVPFQVDFHDKDAFSNVEEGTLHDSEDGDSWHDLGPEAKLLR